MSKNRNYNRYISTKKALRKRRITEEVYCSGKEYPYYDNLHQYSKNKIHCSCPNCTFKTKNRKHGYWNYGKYNRKHSEQKRLLSMNEDYFENI